MIAYTEPVIGYDDPKGKDHMSSPMPPNVPQYGAPQPTPKKTSPLVWILATLGGLLVLGMVACGVVGFLAMKTIQHAGFDPDLMKNNPGLAMTKMVTALNPDLEVVSHNDRSGTIIVREKSTGKTVTYKFDPDKKSLVIIDEKGEQVSFGGGAGNQMPSWVPVYPGSSPEGQYSAQTAEGSTGNFTFKTSDTADKITSFYQDQLKTAGFNVTLMSSGIQGGMLSAEDAASKRTVLVTVGPSSAPTVANITVTEKK
jgi:hypothetical protein